VDRSARLGKNIGGKQKHSRTPNGVQFVLPLKAQSRQPRAHVMGHVAIDFNRSTRLCANANGIVRGQSIARFGQVQQRAQFQHKGIDISGHSLDARHHLGPILAVPQQQKTFPTFQTKR
jgi:hypothetical protein